MLYWIWLVPAAGLLYALGYAGMRRWILPAFFLIRVAAGILYGQVFAGIPQAAERADTWRMHRLALQETQWLRSNPQAFFTDLWTPRYTNDSGLLGTRESLLNDLKEVIPIKLLALINLLTGGDYNSNLVLWNLLCLPGLLAFAACAAAWYGPRGRVAALMALLLPSPLFWCSGLHRDGLMLSLLGGLLYFAFSSGIRPLWRLAGLLGCGALLWLLRPWLAGIFLSGMAAYWGWQKRQISWQKALPVLVVLLLVLVLVGWWVNPGFPAGWLLARRTEFLALSARDVVSTSLFEPNWRGMLAFLPNAIYAGWLTPWPGQFGGALAWLAGLEQLLVWALVGLAIMAWVKKRPLPAGVVAVWLSVAACLLLIGYTIPYLSPILRYKSLLLPMLALPALATIMPAAAKRMRAFFYP